MDAIIEAPAKCEVRAVIRFLQAEGHSAAEIHRRMCQVYGENFMSDGCVREWCRKFREGRTDVHDEGGQGRPSLVTDDLVKKVAKVVREGGQFTISELSSKFPQISRTVLYEIVTSTLGYHKFCEKWVLKTAHGGSQCGANGDCLDESPVKPRGGKQISRRKYDRGREMGSVRKRRNQKTIPTMDAHSTTDGTEVTDER